MPELNFRVEAAEPQKYAAAPTLLFRLAITQPTPAGAAATLIHSALLRAQVLIEPARRSYNAAQQEQLLDLFDIPSRWGQTMRPLLWAHASVVVGPFTETGTVDLPVPCSQDFTLAASKYFNALEEGEVPLCFLFSGTVFYEAADGRLQVSQIPWEKEAQFRLPVPVWQQLMDIYYPNSAWLCLRRDIFDALSRYKSRRGLPGLEQAVEELLTWAGKERVPP